MATRISSEFLINDSDDSDFSSSPDIGLDSQGNFVVVWNQFSSSNNGVVVRRFDNTGDPDGDLIVVDSLPSIADPVIAVAADGRFVVVWDDARLGNDLSVQIYEADDDLDVSRFDVTDDDDAIATSDPDVAMDASNGDFVVTWVQENDDGDRSILAQRFAIDGEEEGAVITVATIDDDDFQEGQRLSAPAVAMDDSGDFVVVWQQDTQEDDDNGFDIFAKRYNSSGAVLDDTFLVNTQQENDQIDPDVATDSSGDFTIVWFSDFINQVGLTPDLDDGIYARQYEDSGAPRGEQFAVAAPDTGDGSAISPAVAMDSSGDTLIVWQNFDTDNAEDSFDIFAQEYDSSGNAVGTPFRVNDEEFDGIQNDAAIAIDPGGDAVVVWQSDIVSSTGTISGQNILGQRVSISGSGTTNGNSGDDNNDSDDDDNNDDTGDDTVPDTIEVGTNTDDTLFGNSEANLIQGLGGNDTIFGKLGDDELSGGDGRDTIGGDGGADTITGGDGADQLFGNAGADLVRGGNGRDTITGGAGADRLFGDAGRDTLLGSGGNDFLSGGDDADLLKGGGGDDALYGGRGNDVLRGGGGVNFFSGGDGRDKLIGRRRSVDTFAIIPGSGLDEIRNFTFREDFLAFEDITTAFNSTEYIRERRGTIVKVNGERVALIRGIDLSVNVLFSEISVELTQEQRLGTPTN